MANFSSYEDLFRIFFHCIIGYIVLVVMLRLTGNRTLSQMNSFDFIINVAMGSAFSAMILQKSVPLSDGLLALFMLIIFQYVITKLAVHSRVFSKIIKSEPILLFHDGEFLVANMHKARVNKDEIKSAMRAQGVSTLSQIECAILETNGQISIVLKQLGEEEKLPERELTYTSK